MERKRAIETDPALKEGRRNLGESLRQKRKEMNLTLREVENATSIRLNFLQALEDGEMNKLISPVYAQGFFKQYAAFLGLDGDHLIRENATLFHRPEAQEFAYGIGTLEVRGNPGAGVKWFPNAVWMVAFGLVLLLAWYMARFFGVI